MSTFRNNFDDGEIIDALCRTPPDQRRGNLWTFYDNLPRPERERLAQAAAEACNAEPSRETPDPG